jgi:NAD-dependent SIR2 family protein deacetylase
VDLPRIRAALARLDDAIEAHGDLAREVCDDAADALESAAELPDVQAANDDVEVCRCPDCEGRGDAGEGDA